MCEDAVLFVHNGVPYKVVPGICANCALEKECDDSENVLCSGFSGHCHFEKVTSEYTLGERTLSLFDREVKIVKDASPVDESSEPPSVCEICALEDFCEQCSKCICGGKPFHFEKVHDTV